MQQTARLLLSMPFQSSTTDYQVSPSTYVRTAQGDGIQLAPADFAMSYITRSRRIDIVRLRKLSPRFVERYERQSC
jgi:hypothetical protein